ncbi:MAG: ArsB/NhaD family transporter [Chloroflexota bacterium]|nr:ArsB/NhaD family transporter [Chloroflexota bacterium]
MSPLIIATLVFVLAYVAIVFNVVHRTVVALLGATLIIALGVLDQGQAFSAIDYNVIFLLVGMMVIANITGTTGVFQWLAIKAARVARGEPMRIMVLLCLITALASAFLDNVTTVVLLVPVTLSIAATLGMNPVPLLVAEVISSNIGGTATLVGDPPNIMVGSAAGLSFTDFIVNLTPVALVALGAFLVVARFLFRKDLAIDPALKDRLDTIDTSGVITDNGLLRKCLIVLAIVVVGFLVHHLLHLEVATIALFGAALLMLISGTGPLKALRDVDWPTLFFFIGLFIIVGGIEEAGLVTIVGERALQLTGGDVALTSVAVLWFSGLASGVVDNIPYTAAMIPLIEELGGHMAVDTLWWALSLGACLGGNLTLIGASANVYAAGVSERAGHPITFIGYLKYGAIATVLTLAIATAFILLIV